MTRLIIPAKHFRKFEDPFTEEHEEGRPVKYRFYAHVSDIPQELLEWMETNPRDQSLNTDVSKAIRESLLDDSVPCFHLWNRGILISAAKITYDNRKGIAELFLDDPQVHGNLDGGHTLRIILQCKRDVQDGKLGRMPEQYVDMEVITGLDFPEALAEARNTSVAVDLKSIEELRKSFEVLKEILDPCYIQGNHYIDRIEFRQNQMRARDVRNGIDVREVVSIINMFNQVLYPNVDLNVQQPMQSFSGKEVGLKRFLQAGLDKDASDEECRAARDLLLRQMAPIIPDIFLLWDKIECTFTEATSQIGKRYGTRKYSNHDKGNRPNAMFSDAALEYTIPKGILYPLVGAFRALVRIDSKGKYYWIAPPLEAWDELKATLATYIMSTSDELSHNPANIGRSPNLWSNLYSNIFVYALQKEAGRRNDSAGKRTKGRNRKGGA